MSKGKPSVHPSVSILSDITVYNKYAKYNPVLKRRETWEEIVTRNKDMHIEKHPTLKDEIEKAYEKYVEYRKKRLGDSSNLKI